MTAKEQAAIVAAVVAALGTGSAPEQPKATPRKGSTRKATPKVAASCITAGIAWELLGADEKFTPKDPNRPATNAQLWSLNAKGLLAVK